MQTKEEKAAYMKEYMKTYVAKNRDKWNAYWKDYRAKNKEQWQEYNNEYQRQYTKDHLDVRLEMVANTRKTLGSGVYAVYSGDRWLYVGCSKQLYRRRFEHMGGNYTSSHPSLREFKQNGGVTEFRILEVCDNVHERETHYIQTLQPEFNVKKKTIK